jgi:lipopolysaccharide export system protein LptA
VERCFGDPARWAAKALIRLLVISAVMFCGADPIPAAERDKSDDRVYILSERLLADTAGRWAEFSGDVKAEQGTTSINADRLKVFYASPNSKPGAPRASTSPDAAGQIERIEAIGHVVIHFDQRVAESDEARYTTADRILVLTGKPARITEGANTVSGGRIVMDRDKNRITVERPDHGRVEAVFYTQDNGLK